MEPATGAEPAIVLDDPAFVVAVKPAGMNTAPLRRGEVGSLLEWVLGRYPDVAGVPGVKAVEPGLMHRLDRDTSGLVLVVRTTAAWDALRTAARAGRFVKRYRALVSPADSPPPGTRALLAPLGSRLREPSFRLSSLELPLAIESAFRAWGPGRQRVAALAPGPGRRLYRTQLLAAAPAAGPPGATGPFFRVLVELAVGFRHQVRVHLAAIGLPIAGDPLYWPQDRPPASQRLMLHACGLEFPHPASGRLVTVAHEALYLAPPGGFG